METLVSAYDNAWYHMEAPNNPMVVYSLSFLQTSPSKELLKQRILDNFVPYGDGRLHCTIAKTTDSKQKTLTYKPVGTLDMNYHLKFHELQQGKQTELEEWIGSLMSKPLDSQHPLWQIYIIHNCQGIASHGEESVEDATCVLLARIHHCYADGISHIRLLSSLFDGYQRNVNKPSDFSLPAKSDKNLVDKVAKSFQKINISSLKFFHKKPEGIKKVTWLPSIPLIKIKQIGKALQATVNDTLLSILAGAWRDYFLEKNIDIEESLKLFLSIPVSIRPEELADDLGNLLGLYTLPLPIGVIDPKSRIAQIHRFMGKLKKSSQAIDFFHFLNSLGNESSERQQEIWNSLSHKYAAVVSNIPGLQEEKTLGGIPILQQLFFPPCNNSIGITTGFLSYNGNLQISLATDENIIADPRQLADFFTKQITIHEEIS
ncbi:MAG: WS/DGAT domain-containing protein [Spirochaetota bacterium]